jgi:catechol 2,3-dioxygenase-like lactoylglutathione lyase family enzyme
MSALSRRDLLLSLPGLAVASRLLAQAGPQPLRVRGLSQVTLAVSDVARSLAFYQGLFGLPIQSRHGSSVLLRLGSGPRFIALTEAGAAPPHIDNWGLSVENFEVGRVLEALNAFGISRAIGGQGLSGGAMHVKVTTRGDTPELFVGDPDGLVMQLQDPSYCGGSGPLGSVCGAPEPAPAGAPLPLVDISHLTVNVTDAQASNAFYRRTFGFDIQGYQATSPFLGVGPGVDFLMFIPAGGRGGPAPAAVNHACFSLQGFNVERVQAALEAHGIQPREGNGPTGAMRHYVSLRMPNRGGAPDGTPELYFTDPDGISIQLQDVTYCGGGGSLGEVCTSNPQPPA